MKSITSSYSVKQSRPKKVGIELWEGFNEEIDLSDILNSAITVKGKTYHNPLRFLEIYSNYNIHDHIFNPIQGYNFDTVIDLFMPEISGVKCRIGEDIYQPPFPWRECDVRDLCINFTYNTNAIYRILSNLSEQGMISYENIPGILDKACVVLSYIYKTRDNFIVKNLNNNLNVYLISKVIEFIVGKIIYNSELQELDLTRRSLERSIEMLDGYVHLNIFDKMGIAIGKGITFIENYLSNNSIRQIDIQRIQEISYKYFDSRLAIDDRLILLNMINNIGMQRNSFNLVFIPDDATETVDDLLWISDLIKMFSFLKVFVLVNTAQISINFSVHMVETILNSFHFKTLSQQLESQLFIAEIHCPFISLQNNYLPSKAKDVISKADAVVIKGMNFFETCQITEKDTFHMFVVYSPISKIYSGLSDYDAVFAYVPAGQTGYIHDKDPKNILTLRDIINNRK